MKSTGKPTSLLFLFLLLQLIMLTAIGAPSLARLARSAKAEAQANDALLPAIETLVSQADTIARAQLIASKSRWNSTHTLIETVHTLAVHYTVLGKGAPEIVIYTDGGFLAQEGIGMRSSHTATFAPGEEVLVFLQRTSENATAGYRIVGGEVGKFTVLTGEAVNAYFQEQRSLEQMAALIQSAATRQGKQTSLPTNWRSYESPTVVRRVTMPDQPWVDPKWPGATPKINVAVNLNSSHIGDQGGNTEQFLTAIKNALRTWSVVESAEFTLLYDGESTATSTSFNNKSEILFMHKGSNSQLGQAQIWFTAGGVIVEADIWLNDDYQLDATGAPQSDEIDVESVVLHELGHWLPLSHVDLADAVMYPVLGAGMRKVILASDDLAKINALYPCPNAPCIDPAYVANTPTPTPATLPTVTATPTPTLSPTATPSGVVGDPQTTPTGTATTIPSVATPMPQTHLFLPLVTR